MYRLQRYSIYYNPKFDREIEENDYDSKLGFASSHQFAVKNTPPGSTVIDLGSGEGYVSKALLKKGCKVHGVDRIKPEKTGERFTSFTVADLDDVASEKNGLKELTCSPDVVLLLDILEHLESPERMLMTLREKFAADLPVFIITVPNVAFAVQRLSLLFGNFNYGKKGILDFSHRRLFTRSSISRVLEQSGFVIEKNFGIPAPLPLIFGKGSVGKFLLRLNSLLIDLCPGLFSYQIGIITRANPSCEVLLERARKTGENQLSTFHHS